VAASLVGFIVVALGVAIVSEGLRTAWERAAAAEQTKDVLLRELGAGLPAQLRPMDSPRHLV